MLASIGLSNESLNLLHARGLSEEQVGNFAELLEKAGDRMEEQTSAKQVLAEMSSDDLKLLQKASLLAESIKVGQLSNEGAMNLFAQPDKTGMVDLNNDGLVEVGAARMMTFPPVNAPAGVHEAWEEATEGMPFADKMILQMTMHHQVYGIHIEGLETKQPLPPEKQWSVAGCEKLMADARAALKFAVSLDGWTSQHLMERDFYDRFEESLASSSEEPIRKAG